MHWNRIFVALLSLAGASFTFAAEPAKFVSHPPMRALPKPSTRPAAEGPAFYVDGQKGNDAGNGSQAKPWKTIQHGVNQLKPGDTLNIASGLYYENVKITAKGTAEKPITLRSSPQSLVILDGGLREFYENPETAWEPYAQGAPGEFRSTKPHPGLASSEHNHAHVFGHFTDSMIPLHGYRYYVDLKSDNEYWGEGLLTQKMGEGNAIYCGPGLWYDLKTEHIHIRLKHTTLKVLGDKNYQGETDPRKLKLSIGGGIKNRPLLIKDSAHVKVQDIVLRGSGQLAALQMDDCEYLEIDGVTSYGAAAPVATERVGHLRLVNSRFRSNAAPWSFRTSLKYRGVEGGLLYGNRYTGGSHDYEIAYSEFTDSHDGLALGNVRNVKFHHNLLENIDDDGIFLTAITDKQDVTWGGNIHIYQNLFRRVMINFTFGIGHGKQDRTGAGVWIYRNVFDRRFQVRYFPPASENDTEYQPGYGRIGGDHGGPIWEPMNIYHNTFITKPSGEAADINGYAVYLASHTTPKAPRRIFNNIFLHIDGLPGIGFPPLEDDFQADGNLNWGLKEGPAYKEDFFAYLKSQLAKSPTPPAWEAHGLFADPQFMNVVEDVSQPLDVRLKPGSPAIDAGVAIPAEWPDPLRESDAGKPDIGALPLGAPLPALLGPPADR